LGAWAVLADQLQAQARDDQQRQGIQQTAAHGRQRGVHCRIEWLAQGQAQHDSQHRQQTEQLADGIGFQQVVQYFVGVHQVVDSDKVEAHAELIPEQPFGHRGEQHREQADGEHRLQEPAMAAATPQRGRAQQQVQPQRKGGIG